MRFGGINSLSQLSELEFTNCLNRNLQHFQEVLSRCNEKIEETGAEKTMLETNVCLNSDSQD